MKIMKVVFMPTHKEKEESDRNTWLNKLQLTNVQFKVNRKNVDMC